VTHPLLMITLVMKIIIIIIFSCFSKKERLGVKMYPMVANRCRRWSACFPCLCSFLAQLTREQMPFIEFNLQSWDLPNCGGIFDSLII
jgi:hypothetical protein